MLYIPCTTLHLDLQRAFNCFYRGESLLYYMERYFLERYSIPAGILVKNLFASLKAPLNNCNSSCKEKRRVTWNSMQKNARSCLCLMSHLHLLSCRSRFLKVSHCLRGRSSTLHLLWRHPSLGFPCRIEQDHSNANRALLT